MKWIEISKARPSFDKDYLGTNGDWANLVTLKSTERTADGVKHTFKFRSGEDIDANRQPTHIALITLPALNS